MVSYIEKIGFILLKQKGHHMTCTIVEALLKSLNYEKFPKDIPDTRRSFLSFFKIGILFVETLEEETRFR